MNTTKSLIKTGSLLSLLFFLKLLYTQTSVEDLLCIIYPVQRAIAFFTGETSQFIADNGYYFQELDIIIDKSCSGFNYFLICLSIFGLISINNTRSIKKNFLLFGTTVILAYVQTIFVNSFRIISTIYLQSSIESFLALNSKLIHTSIGISINISFLIITYLITLKFLKKSKNEKYLTA